MKKRYYIWMIILSLIILSLTLYMLLVPSIHIDSLNSMGDTADANWIQNLKMILPRGSFVIVDWQIP